MRRDGTTRNRAPRTQRKRPARGGSRGTGLASRSASVAANGRSRAKAEPGAAARPDCKLPPAPSPLSARSSRRLPALSWPCGPPCRPPSRSLPCLPQARRAPAAGCRRPRPGTPAGCAGPLHPSCSRELRPLARRQAPAAAAPRAGAAGGGRRSTPAWARGRQHSPTNPAVLPPSPFIGSAAPPGPPRLLAVLAQPPWGYPAPGCDGGRRSGVAVGRLVLFGWHGELSVPFKLSLINENNGWRWFNQCRSPQEGAHRRPAVSTSLLWASSSTPCWHPRTSLTTLAVLCTIFRPTSGSNMRNARWYLQWMQHVTLTKGQPVLSKRGEQWLVGLSDVPSVTVFSAMGFKGDYRGKW